MTRLTATEDPGKEFTVRGRNTLIDADEDEIVFYDDVIKVHVVPERESFTIQVLTADFVVEMDFADVDSVREALEMFEEGFWRSILTRQIQFVLCLPVRSLQEPKKHRHLVRVPNIPLRSLSSSPFVRTLSP
jgi:hypothetical protein